jgi:hypothetical protein
MDSILIENFRQDPTVLYQDNFPGFPDENLETTIAFGDKKLCS